MVVAPQKDRSVDGFLPTIVIAIFQPAVVFLITVSLNNSFFASTHAARFQTSNVKPVPLLPGAVLSSLISIPNGPKCC